MRPVQSDAFASSMAPFFNAHSRKPAGALFTPAMFADLIAAIFCHSMDSRLLLRISAEVRSTPSSFAALRLLPKRSASVRLALDNVACSRSLFLRLEERSEERRVGKACRSRGACE